MRPKPYLLTLLCLLFVSCAGAEDTLSIGNITIEEGRSTIVNITISNSSCDYGFFAMQWDDQVINFTEADCGMYGYVVGMKSRDTTQYYVGSYADYADEYIFGCARITAIGNAGESTDLNIFDSYIIDDTDNYISCRYVDGSVMITPLMGDANTDRVVDVRDAVLLLNHISDQDTVVSVIRSDMNGDGRINILDVVLVINRCVTTT